jgi:hypothetical protein
VREKCETGGKRATRSSGIRSPKNSEPRTHNSELLVSLVAPFPLVSPVARFSRVLRRRVAVYPISACSPIALLIASNNVSARPGLMR